MHTGVARAALVVGVGLVSIAGYNLISQASQAEDFQAGELVSSLGDFPASVGNGAPHELSRLKLLKRTMHFVDEKYVDPARIDPDAMFDSALDSVERRVSEVLFQRSDDGQLLHISVGGYTTTLELPPIDSTSALQDQLSRVAGVLDEHLSEEVDPAQVEYALINGVLGTLDPHSILLPPADAENMDTENSGEFGGLGITITLVDGLLTVEYPLEDTPAWGAGLEPGDQIVRINGESTVNMDLEEAVSRLRGKVGSEVTISVARESWEEPRDIVIERAKIKLNPVKGALLDGDIGYIKVTNFHAAVSGDMKQQLTNFKRDAKGQQIQGLVLDLRGNPGGYLHQAIEVVDLFISDGPIVSTVERQGSKVDETNARGGNTVGGDFPIVVLVDAGSASASEIVAGALKNRGRAVIVGETTFGKGSVQHLYPNEADGSKLKLTVARYLTPGDKSIQAVGIPPDIALDQTIFYEMEQDGETHTLVSMFARERALREADLDGSLEQGDQGDERSVYSMRWLRELNAETERPRRDSVDTSDFEIQFARDLLLASAGKSSRAEILAGVEGVVDRYDADQATHIQGAFKKLGVDWSDGRQPDSPQLSAALDLGSDDALSAGEDNTEVVWLRATNEGDAPVYQVLSVCESGIRELNNLEFYFGKLEPGETKSFPAFVGLDEGYRDEMGQLSCSWQDAAGSELATTEHPVRTISKALPSFEWTYSIVDGGEADTRGDGDGIVEQGELVGLKVQVTNTGEGASKAAFVKLKNRAGKAVDLKTGSQELGELAPGESAEALLLFQVGLSGAELPFEILVGDGASFNHAVVWRAGFQETFAQMEELAVPVGTAPEWGARKPPELTLSRHPELVETQSGVVLSGQAVDESAVQEVIVYHLTEDETDKVFYQGGQDGITAMPWTVDARLEPGANLFVILTRDDQGLTDTASVNVWFDDSAVAAE